MRGKDGKMSRIVKVGHIIPDALPGRQAKTPATGWSTDGIAQIKKKLDIVMRFGNNPGNPDERFSYQPVCPSWIWKPEFSLQYNAITAWIAGLGHLGDGLEVNPMRGLWLAGNPGTGKSTLLRAVRNFCAIYADERSPNLPRHMLWRHAKDIASGYEEDGARYLTELCEVDTLIIDDLGTEPLATMRYGNSLNVVEELLSRRYDRGKMTMVTTNLKMDQVKKDYRERIYDRVREMFNVIEFIGPSHRKNFNPQI